MKKKLPQKIMSIILCLALLVSYLPAAVQVTAADVQDRVSDPSTMDNWKKVFLSQPLNTENAGGVWTDKSVFTDASAFAGTGISLDSPDDSFLVALSAIASNMSITGLTNVPTDTMMILDLSSSMYNGTSRDPSTVQIMIDAVNDSIDKLQDLNEHNRVGVVIYYGGQNRLQSDSTNSMVLLPLGRYTATSTYLKTNVSSGKLTSISVASGVKDASGAAVPQTTRTVTDVAGTYAQLGILDAMDQLLAATTTVPATADYQPNAARLPVMIFMSDGEPTAATHQYTQKVDAGMGNNTVSIRNPDETDFVTQLTAAYAKEMVDAHYEETEPLFYSLSLGTSVSLAVMEPSANTTATIDGYWTSLLNNGNVSITVTNSPDAWSAPSVKKTYTVSKTTVDGSTFPSSKRQRNYVDKAFTATTASDLTSAFVDIVDQISLVSEYSPTLITDNDDISGYISFVDRIGEYMEVTDIKGILIDEILFSGAELARNFVTGGGDLGTYDEPSSLGDEMVWAVQARLGLDVDTARTLLGLAYDHGQLSYTSDTEFSNYIGWYANAAGEYLGFWYEGIQTMPEPTGDPATDPAFIIKSYGYLGAVDESHGVEASDMMYATVQLREEIATGEQRMVFAVPAALIPVVTYAVALDQEGELSDLTVSGAEHPIRLVYEVSLDDAIDPYTLKQIVDPEYLAAHTDADGNVWFYSNQYETDNSTGYEKVNAYSYFNPSRENDRYYYLEDSPVYTDQNGTLYVGDTQPSGTYYRSYTVYEKDGDTLRTRTAYRQIPAVTLATTKQAPDGSWYVGAGNVRVDLEGYTVTKTQNPTGTLTDAYIPFVDAHNHSVGELGYNFIVGATLGNNGRLTMTPATGIALTKTMADDATAPTEAFRFTITNTSDPADDGTYPARLVGDTSTETSVQFRDGKATVSLNAGETLYIDGLTPGADYTVEEIQTLAYIPDHSQVTVTVVGGEMVPVQITNADRGQGDLTISKTIRHSLGTDHAIPADLRFTIDVSLSGVGVQNATFEAIHTDGSITSVTTDGDGRFTVTLANDQQVQILGLPEGTIATVTEPDPGVGFTAVYREDGQSGDGIVTIQDGATASVTVRNEYTSEPAPVNVVLKGTKILTTDADDWNGAEFQFQLQKSDGEGWITIGTATATEASPSFDFDEALSKETFTAPGTYHYQVLETNGGETIDGILYDATLHTFSIIVTDKDMDGTLEIDKVTSTHSGRDFATNADGDWQIDISFTNIYEASGTTLVLDVQKALTNASGSPAVSLAGFRFGLYDQDGQLVGTSELSDGVGEARLVMEYELKDAGTHTYTLKEICPDSPIPGMTYSDTGYEVVVEVTDNGDGTISAAIVSIDGETDYEIPVFTNVYEPDPAELEIDFVRKSLTGRDLVAGEFTFELRENDTVLLTGTNDAEGNVIFDGKLTFDTVGSFFYHIYETSTDGNGVTTDKTVYDITLTVSDVDGQLEVSYQVLNVVGEDILFKNTYAPAPTSYTIAGTKTLEGRVLINDEFTFLLTQVADAKGTALAGAPTQSAKNHTDGSFAFDPIGFTEAGTYYYLVSETDNGDPVHGVQYDTTEYVVAITVTDDLEGALVVSDVTITILGGGTVDEIGFTNIYVPAPITTQIPGSKTLTGKLLNGGDFTFDLYASNEDWAEDTLLETVSNDEDGSFCFSQITYDTAGLYYYLVKETHGGETIDGVTYDDTVYRVAIEITDDLRGQLRATIHIYDEDGDTREAITFQNVYTITGDAEVTLEGTKTLTGKDLTDGDFTFELYETDESFTVSGDPLQTTVNTDGAFRLNLHYTAEDVGSTHYYVVRERNGGEVIDGVTYDDTVYQIVVQIDDDGTGGIRTTTNITDGTLSVTSLDFVNRYTVTGEAEVTLEGTKTLTGKELNDGDFTFELYETDESFTVSGDPLQTTVNTDGAFRLSLSYTAEDVGSTHYYVVTERNGGEVIDGVTYDDTVYQIVVQIDDDGTGGIRTTTNITDGTLSVTSLDFVNHYEAEPTQIRLEGTKTLTGKDLTEGSFTFELYASDEDWAQGGLLQTVTNGADGSFAFSQISYDTTGTFYYLVKETNGGSVIDGVTYDDTEYRIAVEVTDDLEGQLQAAVSIYDGTGEARQTIVFRNFYTVTGEAQVTLAGTKTLIGKDLTDGSFTFELYETDESFTVSGTPIQTVTNTNGVFTLTLDYTSDDVGSTYYYVVRERDAGRVIDGVTYDDAEYHITVTVTDGGDGSIRTDARITDGTQPVTKLDFVNHYEAEPTQIQLEGTKILTGKELNEGDFTFELYASDADWAQGGLLQTVTNGADGSFAFNQISYDTTGTFYYLVKETNGGQTIGNVAYDDTVYRIRVEVTDDLAGQLHATVHIYGEQAIVFRNTYTITGEADVTLEGTKTLFGKELTDGAFTFELYRADSRFQTIGSPIQTVTNTDGRFRMDLHYTADDLGETFYYVVRERNGGEVIDGVTYDDTEYHITVTVVEDGNGGIQAQVCVTDGSATVTRLDFVNRYEATPTLIRPEGTKILVGKDLNKGDFTFELYRTNSRFDVLGRPIQTVSNGADGRIRFAPIVLTEAGVYHFVILEDTDEPMEGVTYDTTRYLITVVVEDNGQGQLVVARMIILRDTAAGSATVDTVIFKNRFDPPTEPEEPTDPPTEPEEPTDPPTEPEEPTDPPTEPEEPTDPPTEPEEPTDPPTEPEEPTDPPTEPEDPTDPPTEPEEPTDPPTEPEEPTDPPTEPEEPTDPPTEPEEPTDPPTEPEEPTDPPTEPEKPTEPEEPDVPDIPQTGDTHLAIWVAMMAVSAGGVITLLQRRKKQDEEA